MENLTNMGKEARQSFIKSSHGQAVVYFKVPMQIVKIEHTTQEEGYAKINRLLVKALNGAYGTVLKALQELQKSTPTPEQSQAFAQREFAVMAEDQMAVRMKGDFSVDQVGLTSSDIDHQVLKTYFNDVIIAANDGARAAHKKGLQLIAKHIQ